MCTNILYQKMSLSDSEFQRERKSVVSRPLEKAGRSWSDKQKVDAVATYFLLGGNLKLVSSTLTIPYDTLKTWKKSQWWKDLERDLRQEETLKISTKFRSILEKSLDIVEDRLAHGDWIYNQKTGEMIRKEVSIRDASKVAIDAANIRQKLELEENYTVAQEQIQDKLSKLAEAFSALAKGQKFEEPAEDIEFVEVIESQGDTEHALHEEREEGL